MTNTPSSTSSFSLRLDKPLTSSSFDRWLQIEYLPSDFKHNENNGQDHARRKWYKRIKFDLNEFLHLFSIAILIIWISSVLIFGIYLSGPCSPLMYHRDQQLAKKVEESTAYRAINNSLASSNTSIRFFSPLASGLYRAHQIFLKRLAQNKKSNYNEIEENLPSCIIMTAYAISNFSLSSLLLFHLFFYIFHIVEFSFIFPWFAIEIAYSSVFVILTFIFDVVLCIISPVRTTELIVTLGNLQFVFGLIFCKFHFLHADGRGRQVKLICPSTLVLNRYNQCLSGKLPQDLSDDVDGDYIRRNLNNLKSIFHKRTTPEMRFRRNSLKRKSAGTYAQSPFRMSLKQKVKRRKDGKTLAVFKSSQPTLLKAASLSKIQQSKKSTALLKSKRKSQSRHHRNSRSSNSSDSRQLKSSRRKARSERKV